MPPARLRAAVLFHRFGPYHLSRLDRAARELDVHGIELSATDRVYAWNGTQGQEQFPRTVVSPDLERERSRAVVRRVADILDRLAPDVVAIPGWSDRGALAALLWCARSGTPAVMMSDSTARDHPRRAWREAVKRGIVGMCSSALVAGTRARDYAVRLGMPANQIRLGFDVVDNAHFSRGAARARQDEAATRAALGLPGRYVLTVCRFVADKNLPVLIEAYDAYHIRAGVAAWPLVIAGDGPIRPAITQMLRDRGLGAHVHLPGFLQYDALPAYYGLAGAFVLPSIMEPWGLVVNEAMAAGLPVIVSERCGCAEDLVDSNGARFDPHDTSALTRHLGDMASTACGREAMGQRSQAIIAAWSPDRFAEGLREASELALRQPVRAGLAHQALVRALIGGQRAAAPHNTAKAGASANGDPMVRSSTNSA